MPRSTSAQETDGVSTPPGRGGCVLPNAPKAGDKQSAKGCVICRQLAFCVHHTSASCSLFPCFATVTGVTGAFIHFKWLPRSGILNNNLPYSLVGREHSPSDLCMDLCIF